MVGVRVVCPPPRSWFTARPCPCRPAPSVPSTLDDGPTACHLDVGRLAEPRHAPASGEPDVWDGLGVRRILSNYLLLSTKYLPGLAHIPLYLACPDPHLSWWSEKPKATGQGGTTSAGQLNEERGRGGVGGAEERGGEGREGNQRGERRRSVDCHHHSPGVNVVLALYLHLAAAGSQPPLLLGGTSSFLGPKLHGRVLCPARPEKSGGAEKKKPRKLPHVSWLGCLVVAGQVCVAGIINQSVGGAQQGSKGVQVPLPAAGKQVPEGKSVFGKTLALDRPRLEPGLWFPSHVCTNELRRINGQGRQPHGWNFCLLHSPSLLSSTPTCDKAGRRQCSSNSISGARATHC